MFKLCSPRRSKAAFAIAAVLSASAGADAQEGVLDTTFHLTGRLVFGVPDQTEVVQVLSAPEGRLAVLARGASADNLSDEDYWMWIADGGHGPPCVLSELATTLPEFAVSSARIDHLGRLVVVGTNDTDDQILVARFLFPQCMADSEFGTNGLVTISSGLWADVRGVAIVERPSGILFPTYSYYVLAENGGTIFFNRGALLLRLTAGGELDTGWGGGDGWVSHTFAPDIVVPVDLELELQLDFLSDRRLVAAFNVLENDLLTHDFGVARFLSNGSPDTTFSADGYRRIPLDFDGPGSDDVVHGMDLDRANRVVLVGQAPNASGVERPAAVLLTEAGGLDASFSGDGKLLMASRRRFHDVAFLDDGRLVLAGEGTDIGFRAESFILRLTATGGADSSFGSGGFAIFPPIDFGEESDAATGVALLSDGKTVAAGWGQRTVSDKDGWVMRFTGPDPPPDPGVFADGFESGDTGAWSATAP